MRDRSDETAFRALVALLLEIGPRIGASDVLWPLVRGRDTDSSVLDRMLAEDAGLEDLREYLVKSLDWNAIQLRSYWSAFSRFCAERGVDSRSALGALRPDWLSKVDELVVRTDIGVVDEAVAEQFYRDLTTTIGRA